jgi:hypothetical protein
MSKNFKPKLVEIISERKWLTVQPAFIVDSSDAVPVDVCVKCGSVVFDVLKHDTWHRDLMQELLSIGADMRGLRGDG